MIQTKNLEDLLDKNIVKTILMKYRNECNLSDCFEIVEINRAHVLSPLTYALLYTVVDGGNIKKIRANASGEETRIRGYKIMNLLGTDFTGPINYVPKPYFYCEDYNMVSYENVEGNILINDLKDIAILGKKIKMSAFWLKKLHSGNYKIDFELPHHKVDFNFEALKNYYFQLASDGERIVEELKSQLKDENKILIHGDYQPNNIIIDHDKITAFDFNDSQIENQSLDVAKFLTQLKVMLTRFSDVSLFPSFEKIFLNAYALDFNKENFLIYSKIYYLQILCSLSASLAGNPERETTLPKIFKYWEESNA